jgi:hypothetical protein
MPLLEPLERCQDLAVVEERHGRPQPKGARGEFLREALNRLLNLETAALR